MFSRNSRRSLSALGTAAALSLLLTACGGEAASSDAVSSFEEMDEVTIKMATIYGPENYTTIAMERYTDAVSEATEGKVQFEYYYAGSLLPQNEMAGGLTDGTIDMAEFMMVYTPSDFPVDNWATKLAFMSDDSPVVGGLQARAATFDLAFDESAFKQELNDNNMHALVPRMQTVHGYDLLCKEPVETLDDIAGKRIRVGGEAWSQEVENLGGTPVNLPAAESYTALQQGVVDCHLGGTQEIDGMSMTDLAKNYTTLGLTGWTSAALAMNQDTWDDLPQIAKEAFEENLGLFIQAHAEETYNVTHEFIQNATENGVEFITPADDVIEKIDSYHEQLVSELPDLAPDQVEDPSATIANYQEAHDRWENILTEELGMDVSAKNWFEYVEQNPDGIGEDIAQWADRVYSDVIEPGAASNNES